MSDHKQELMIIKELMDKLVDEMEPSASDFEERLGRKKPEVTAISVEGILPEESLEEPMEMEDDLEDDLEDESMLDMEMEESPEEKLKKRLMKLRG